MDTTARLNACLDKLAAGDLAARDQIIELCSERLRALTHRMIRRYPGVRRHDDTDDVFQNAMMRLHHALGQMAMACESPRSLMGLAATQIHRELIDLARRYSSPSSFAANHGSNAIKGSGSERYFVEEAAGEDEPLDRWELFHQVVQKLPPEQKEVFHLVWYLGADQRTIAGVMDCSERTIKNYWRQAREAVKAALDGQSPG